MASVKLYVGLYIFMATLRGSCWIRNDIVPSAPEDEYADITVINQTPDIREGSTENGVLLYVMMCLSHVYLFFSFVCYPAWFVYMCVEDEENGNEVAVGNTSGNEEQENRETNNEEKAAIREDVL